MLIVVGAALVATVAFLSVSGSQSSANLNVAARALKIAEAGLERGSRRFGTGTACNALAETQNFGGGRMVIAAPSAGFDPTMNFDNVTPLAGGQCRIRSTGTISNASRITEVIVAGGGGVPAFVASATNSVNSSNAITVNVPAGVTTGDVMLAQITVRGGTGQTITPPGGWALVPTNGRVNSGTTLAQAIYVRVAGGAEPASYTWTFTNSERAAAAILAYSGVNTTTPVDVSSGQANASSTSATAATVTTTVANTRLVAFFGRPNGNDTWNAAPNPSGMTQRFTPFGSSAGPNGAEILAADEARPTAGATGNRTAGASSSLISIGHLVALRPSGAGGGGATRVAWREVFP